MKFQKDTMKLKLKILKMNQFKSEIRKFIILYLLKSLKQFFIVKSIDNFLLDYFQFHLIHFQLEYAKLIYLNVELDRTD